MDLPRFSLGKVAPSAGSLRERKALRVQESRDSPTPHPRPLKRRPGSQRWQRTGTLGRGSVLEDIIEGEKERTVEERRGGRKRRGGAGEDGTGSGGGVRIRSHCSSQQRGGERPCFVAAPPPRHREEGLAGQGKGSHEELQAAWVGASTQEEGKERP